MPEPITIAVMGGGITGLTLRFARRGFHEIKRALDLVGATLLMLVLGPVVLAVSALIKLESKGPAFFMQIRVGKDGKLFRIIKLRTMRADAEKATGPVWARKQDTRITKLGAFLRKTHIDEFPQLINVLRGEMSLIGPRPERPFFVNRFRREIPNYEQRLAVKPGITGLAQVRYKYDESLADVRNKLTYDLVYIKRMSPAMDARILMWTLGTMNGHNAN
jgi:lipopolysaccharide/colanic/teichoic acid biosynthesis glycosyltransferase